jgi:hypothetical protein
MKKIYTFIVVAIAACVFVSCGSVESKVMDIAEYELKMDELKLEAQEIELKVGEVIIGMETATQMERALDDFED